MIMNESTESPKFPVRCPDALKKYNGKKAAFQAQCGDKYFELVGELVVHPMGERFSIDLIFRGPPISEDSPLTPKGVAIHLSQECVESIIPASLSLSGDGVDFQVQMPFQFRHCFSSTSDRSLEP